MTKVPVLVTGGAGYIGSHAVLALKDAGWPVAVIDNLTTGFRFAVPDDVPFYQGDIADADLLARIIAEQGIGAIMHFAGSIIVPESVSDPLKYYHNNTAKTRSLIESAVNGGVKHFIFSSTAATYGIPEVSPVTEDSVKQPINPYGMSKLMSEIMLADTAKAHPLNYCVLRYFNVAGADAQARTGQSTAGATHLIKVAVEAALGKRESVGVFGTDFATPDGTGVRDYIHVSDLADAHVLALGALIAEPERSLTMNCGYGRGFSVLDVLDAVDRVTNLKIKRVLQDRRAGDPDALISDNSRIKATLPWVPRHADLDTIIRHAIAWERKLTDIRGTARPPESAQRRPGQARAFSRQVGTPADSGNATNRYGRAPALTQSKSIAL
ncbi:UDP-glucose 4-epimerase GalE [Novosphingobium pokkalii]|uniref:UDP-glucose 4-epimerase GalE n=1 Tax=Novosphingobium pokkalii TaxID=1770194 RepID=UPI003626C413